MATLSGKTITFNAPDARLYDMDKTVTVTSGVNPEKIFDEVPAGTDHVAVCSHAGPPNLRGRISDTSLSMFIRGADKVSTRLDVTNCKPAFAGLKNKLSEDAVIWLGGCNIGANKLFCETAAVAAGRTVMAATGPCSLQKLPKNTIDLLDGFSTSRVWGKKDGKDGQYVDIKDFCANQAAHKFKLPV